MLAEGFRWNPEECCFRGFHPIRPGLNRSPPSPKTRWMLLRIAAELARHVIASNSSLLAFQHEHNIFSLASHLMWLTDVVRKVVGFSDFQLRHGLEQ